MDHPPSSDFVNAPNVVPETPEQAIARLQAQVQQQQQLLESLTLSSHPAHLPHSLPARPQYTWTPSEDLVQLLPELQHELFAQQLPEDNRKMIIELYPPMANVEYNAPRAVPDAARRFSAAQLREDTTLRQLQYQLSAVFRPLDVLAHELLPLLPQEQVGRIFSILRDTRSLLLHAAGALNGARNNVAFRAINPGFASPSQTGSYTMSPEAFQSAVSQQTATQKAFRDARPRFNTKRPSSGSDTTHGQHSSFFRHGGQSGGAGWSQSRGPNKQQQHHSSSNNRSNNRRYHSAQQQNGQRNNHNNDNQQ